VSEHDPRSRASGGDADPSRTRPRHRTWPWWVAGFVALLAAAVVSTEPWTAGRAPSATLSSGPRVSATPTPRPVATTRPRPPVFDATTLASLFVSQDALVGAVPAAAPGLLQVATTDPPTWGLPAGSTIEPPNCTIASTVVADPPAAFAQRSWTGTAVAFVERITLLPDVPSAESAFGALVTTVDACATYSRVDPGGGGPTTLASPATEAQGVYPSLVQRAEVTSAGTVEPQLRGHVLVGNAIVTWTASASASSGAQADAGALGSGARIDAMIQAVAARAAASLEPFTPVD
jgi:hypothetical protein